MTKLVLLLMAANLLTISPRLAFSDMPSRFSGQVIAPSFLESGATANRACVLDGSKEIVSSSVTDTELGYLSGVTSSIQSQINGKQDALSDSANIAFTDVSNTFTSDQNFQNNIISQSAVEFQIANDSSIGTSLYHLAKYSSSGSAVSVQTSDVTGIIGVVESGAGTAGSANLAKVGAAICTFDGAVTAGHYVVASVISDGKCHDAGTSKPTGTQIIGRVISTHGSGGDWNLWLDFMGEGGGSGGSSVVLPSPTPSGDLLGMDGTNFVSVHPEQSPSPSTIPFRDGYANLSANNFIAGYNTTATAAGTTTLTVTSARKQVFTGTSTQTVVLPVVSTLAKGTDFIIQNNSTGIVTVQSSGGNAVAILSSGQLGVFTSNAISGTGASVWDYPNAFAGITPITATQSYPFSLTGSSANPTLGTNTSSATYQQVGDTIYVDIAYHQSGAGSAGSGAYLFALPPGLTFDSSVLTATNANGAGANSIGEGWAANNSTANTAASLAVQVFAYDSSHFALAGPQSAFNSSQFVGSSNFDLSASTVYFSFHAHAKISQWAGIVPASVTNTQVPQFSVNTSTTSATSSSPFIYSFIEKDNYGGYNASTGTYTIPAGEGGLWQWDVTNFSGSSSFSAILQDNGTNICQGHPSISGSDVGTLGCQRLVSAGDVIRVIPPSSVTASGSGYLNQFSGHMIQPYATAPAFNGQVSSTGPGQYHQESAHIGGATSGGFSNCTSSTCSLYGGYTGWLTATRSAAGTYQLNFTAGEFSAAPQCTFSCNSIGNGYVSIGVSAAPTSTTYNFLTGLSASGTASDSTCDVICFGAY